MSRYLLISLFFASTIQAMEFHYFSSSCGLTMSTPIYRADNVANMHVEKFKLSKEVKEAFKTLAFDTLNDAERDARKANGLHYISGGVRAGIGRTQSNIVRNELKYPSTNRPVIYTRDMITVKSADDDIAESLTNNQLLLASKAENLPENIEIKSTINLNSMFLVKRDDESLVEQEGILE